MRVVEEAGTPPQRSLAERAAHPASLAWPPGRTWIAREGESIVAVARSALPPPGDGYHREHVRTIRAWGAVGPLASALEELSLGMGEDVRLEASAPGSASELRRALESVGLATEARLPHGWGSDDLVLLGRPASALRGASKSAWPTPPRSAEGGELTIVAHGPETRAALSAFIASLVPGRSYPAGTLLSEAERGETRRRGALEAAWLLAMDPDGVVVGGLILDSDARPQRAHVRREHLDVLPRWRGRGVATALLRASLRVPEVGRAEADPVAANLGACRALEAAGFERVGTQVGAWRMRGPAGAWDEDVAIYSAAPS